MPSPTWTKIISPSWDDALDKWFENDWMVENGANCKWEQPMKAWKRENKINLQDNPWMDVFVFIFNVFFFFSFPVLSVFKIPLCKKKKKNHKYFSNYWQPQYLVALDGTVKKKITSTDHCKSETDKSMALGAAKKIWRKQVLLTRIFYGNPKRTWDQIAFIPASSRSFSHTRKVIMVCGPSLANIAKPLQKRKGKKKRTVECYLLQNKYQNLQTVSALHNFLVLSVHIHEVLFRYVVL